MQAWKFEPGGFVKTASDVECLYRLAGGAFHEVVERADHHQSVAVRIAFEADVAVIAAGENFRLG